MGMHELSLAASVVEIALRNAAGRRVIRVEVEVGALRQAVPAALTFSFDMVAQGTLAEGAVLDIQAIPARGACRRCGAVGELHAFPLQCPSCGAFDLDIVAGEELLVASLEVEESDEGEHDDGEHDEDSGHGGHPGCQ